MDKDYDEIDLQKSLIKLKKIFYNPKYGFVSLKKLYEKSKYFNLNLPFKEVKRFYEKQSINQVMKPIRKPKEFKTISSNYAGETFMMDIINYDRYKNHNYKYILVIIDVYSRFMMAKAMTSRELPTIIKKFEEMINSMGAPYQIQCDNEFNKKQFLDLLDDYDIKYRFTDPHEKHKNAIVERVNGTIANLLQKIRISTSKYDWYNYLDDVVINYNSTVHSSTNHTPYDIYKGRETNDQKINNVENKIYPGDKVRIITTKKIFDKGDIMKSSKKIYTVEEADNNRIKLIDDDKRYKPYELQKITEVDENDEIEIPATETNKIKLERLHKRIDVDTKNILSYGRVRVKNKKYL